jgi:hypothetical protein
VISQSEAVIKILTGFMLAINIVITSISYSFIALYFWSNRTRMIKSRRMRWVGYVARTEAKRAAYRILVGKPDGYGPLGRPKCRKQDNIKIDPSGKITMVWTGFIWRRIGIMADSCEQGNELSDSVKCWLILA